MEIVEIFRVFQKNLENINNELGFSKANSTDENALVFDGDKGVYRIVIDSKKNIMTFECSYENKGDDTDFKTISQSLFDVQNAVDGDLKSATNEISDELTRLFKVRKKIELDKVKMPKSVSRTKAKNGNISYDSDSLANRFGALYPEMKDLIKMNIVTYGEFLPETFFIEHGTPKVMDVIKHGTAAEQKKLFKMLGEVFEDGTNEVQDIIAVTILGEMKNDKGMMAVADKYMTEYMAAPVHEVNKLTAKKNKWTKKLSNPPAYKPKKAKSNSLMNTLNNVNR